MTKLDRQSERLNNMSGGGQIGGTNFGQTAGTSKETSRPGTRRARGAAGGKERRLG